MPPLYRSSSVRMIVWVMGAAALIFAFISFWALWPPAQHRHLRPAITLVWTLAPPLWFFVEYAWVFDNWSDENATARFKDLQALAAKVWAGVLALLTAAYLFDKSSGG